MHLSFLFIYIFLFSCSLQSPILNPTKSFQHQLLNTGQLAPPSVACKETMGEQEPQIPDQKEEYGEP